MSNNTMTTQPTEPLWPNPRIEDAIWEATEQGTRLDYLTPLKVDSLMCRVRDEMQAALQQAQARNAELLRMMESLTPGGSEFHNSPQRCIDFAKDTMRSRWESIRKLVRERNQARQEAEGLRITCDSRGSLIDGMEEAIEEMQAEINELAYCEACGGERTIEVVWEMPRADGSYRHIPCTRCDGTGREHVANLIAERDQLRARVEALEAQEWETVDIYRLQSSLNRYEKSRLIVDLTISGNLIMMEDDEGYSRGVYLPTDIRIQRRKRGEVGDGAAEQAGGE